MKILWLVNIILPYAAQKLRIPAFAGGGWISSQLDSLKEYSGEDLSITVLSVCDFVSDITYVEDRKIKHILLPKSAAVEKFFASVLATESPDIVHIYGTEFGHTLEMLHSSDAEKTVVSIQGLVAECSRVSHIGLPKSLTKFSLPKKLIYKCYGIPSARETKNDLFERSKQETAALQAAKHIIGRTAWDKNCCLEINPSLNYHFCNEILREEFYTDEMWSFDNCQKHSIFVSQASYAIKGFHLFLPVFAELVKKYPDSIIYVAGDSQKLHQNKIKQVVGDYVYDYGAFLNRLITHYHLESHIQFLGNLNAMQMKEQYLKSNLFLSCSVIENSPNSVGEAMMLGVPIVSSDVGGVSSIFTNCKDGLAYPIKDSKKQYNNIISIFENVDKAQEYGKNASIHAHKTHDKKVNTQALLQIYADILNGDTQQI